MSSQNTTFAVERILESQGKFGLLNPFVQFLLGQGDDYSTDAWSCTIQICLSELQTKLSFPLPQTNFWQRRQLRTKLTKHGAAPAKGEVQASYFMLLTGQRLLAGLHFWLLDKLSHARYYFSTLPRKYGRISTIVSFWGPSGYPRYGSSCLETGKGTGTVWLLRSLAFLVFCHLQRIIYKPNGNYIYPVLYTALDY